MGTGSAALAAGKALSSMSATPRTAESTGAVQTVEMHEDVTLVRRTLAGDQQAFASLVDKYKDSVFNVSYRMLGNPSEAEDVAQETFVRAYTQLHTYKDAHRFSTWLLSIASHLSIDQLRRRRFLAAFPLVKPLPLLDITDPQDRIHLGCCTLIRSSTQNVPAVEFIDERRWDTVTRKSAWFWADS